MTLSDITKLIQNIVEAPIDGVYGPITANAILNKLTKSEGKDDSDILNSRTAINLETLDPKAQAIFRPFIKEAIKIARSMGCEYVAISGNRGKDEQNSLYEKGRSKPGKIVTNAKFGYSNHNFGIALDFGVFSNGKYLDSSDPDRAEKVHRSVSFAASKYGIDWGGHWKTFKDYPHFEIRTNLSMHEKRLRLFSGKSVLD
jgi:peptidoglycan LD-endopeptidase CwlK